MKLREVVAASEPPKKKKALHRVLSNISKTANNANFGPAHLHLSGGFEDRGVTQLTLFLFNGI